METNKLIAEFMGQEIANVGEMRGIDIEDLEYNSSWDWLMPVAKKCVDKADEMGERFFCKEITDSLGNFLIENVYEDCVGFIKWYNESYTKCSVCSTVIGPDDECYGDQETGNPLCTEHARYDEVNGTYHEQR